MKNERTTEGVLVVKDGKAWQKIYSDGRCTAYGWGDINDAPLTDPEYCKKPQHLTYKGSPDAKKLKQGRIVKVRRVVTTEIIEPDGE